MVWGVNDEKEWVIESILYLVTKVKDIKMMIGKQESSADSQLYSHS